MQRIFLSIGLSALAVLMAVSSAAAATALGAVPAAVVQNPNYMFPVVVEGQEVQHDFIIRNTGSAALEVHKVKTG